MKRDRNVKEDMLMIVAYLIIGIMLSGSFLFSLSLRRRIEILEKIEYDRLERRVEQLEKQNEEKGE